MEKIFEMILESIKSVFNFIRNIGIRGILPFVFIFIFLFGGYFATEDNIDTVMFLLDRNKDGEIDYNELSTVITILGLWQDSYYFYSLFQACDADGNGRLDREEMKNFLKRDNSTNQSKKQDINSSENIQY